jgi:hypothetical protein
MHNLYQVEVSWTLARGKNVKTIEESFVMQAKDEKDAVRKAKKNYEWAKDLKVGKVQKV